MQIENRRCRSAHDATARPRERVDPTSAMNPEESINPEPNLTPAEIDSLNRLEAMAREGLGTYLQVGDALTEIRDECLYRDSHPSFEAYVRERWGVIIPNGNLLSQTTIRAGAPSTPPADREPCTALRNKPCEVLARACEETLSALAGDDPTRIEIRLDVHRQGDPDSDVDGDSFDLSEVVGPISGELLPTLRWLLTQASGTIGEVAYQLESRAADVDDGARAQLRDDVLVLDAEVAVVKALLFELVDWDSELRRLLDDELPPRDTDTDPENDE
jgi:hypothetical protein